MIDLLANNTKEQQQHETRLAKVPGVGYLFADNTEEQHETRLVEVHRFGYQFVRVSPLQTPPPQTPHIHLQIIDFSVECFNSIPEYDVGLCFPRRTKNSHREAM